MMAEQNMQEFIEVLSSKAAVPGGGGACAYVAAAGMALGAMVANLTTGKKKYAQYQEEIEELLSKAEQLSKELMTYMDKDADCLNGKDIGCIKNPRTVVRCGKPSCHQ